MSRLREKKKKLTNSTRLRRLERSPTVRVVAISITFDISWGLRRSNIHRRKGNDWCPPLERYWPLSLSFGKWRLVRTVRPDITAFYLPFSMGKGHIFPIHNETGVHPG